jgi:(2Fe-2S) ferredoxin
MRQVFVCTTGFPGHWTRTVAEHRDRPQMSREEIARAQAEQPEHSNGHFGDHCGDYLGGDLYERFRLALDANPVADVMLTPNACIAQHVHGSMVMVYPEGVWYKLASLDEVEEIIDSHLRRGTVVERLVHKQVKPAEGAGLAAVTAGG